MNRWTGRVVLVTGASVGIGYALSKKLLGNGMKVVACARNIAPIEELSKSLPPGQTLRPIRCDVSNEDEVLAMFKAVETEFGRVDICVNNAGLGHNCSILEGKSEDMKRILDVNVLGLAMVTREAVALMRRAGVDDGQVINVNSMSGHRVVSAPGSAMYTASKFAVTALTESLRRELRAIDSGIRVSSVSPGLVNTEFVSRAFGQEAADKLLAKDVLEAEDIVEAIMYTISAPASVQVHDILMRHTKQVF